MSSEYTGRRAIGGVLAVVAALIAATLVAAAAYAATVEFIQAENIDENCTQVQVITDSNARPMGGTNNALEFANGCNAGPELETFSGPATSVTVRARAVNTDNSMPKLRVFADGTTGDGYTYAADNVLDQTITSTSFATYTSTFTEKPQDDYNIYVSMSDWQPGDKVVVDTIKFENASGSELILVGAGDIAEGWS